MKSGIIYLSIVLFVIFAFSGLVSAADLYGNNTTITLERGMCYGTCPVYAVTLSGNGTVIYDGQQFVKDVGIRCGTINQSSFETLRDQFTTAGFFEMNDSYTAYDITDMPWATITLTSDGRMKRIEHYYGDMSAPKILTGLEDAIDQAANVTQWTEPWEPSKADKSI